MAGKLSFALAAAAVAWCAALVIHLPHPGDEDILPAVVLPALLAVGGFAALHRACHGHRGLAAAWLCGWLLFAYAVITGLSIGIFVMPAAMAVLVAATIVPRPR